MPARSFPTKALRKFLATLTSRESPVLMDLGPVVGSNVTFFGERLGCKIILEDLFADLERYPKNSETPFAEYLKTRLKHQDGSVDGILCWNFFDFLDLPSAQALAVALTKLLRPDGAVLAFFTTVGARRHALLEVRDHGRRLGEAAAVFVRRQEADVVSEPRHHPDVRRAESL